MIAALYVQRGGIYYDLEGVEPWGEDRDARLYDGPWPVVAHPPCARWGRYWFGGPSARVRRKLGDDDGCFEAAYEAVHRFGGVLEHPEASAAWHRYDIPAPPKGGGWVKCLNGFWTCCVEQGHYGHLARKATWLYLVGVISPPSLIWGPAEGARRLGEDFHSAEERRRATRTGSCQRLSARQRSATPETFRDLLLALARMTQPLDKGRPIFPRHCYPDAR